MRRSLFVLCAVMGLLWAIPAMAVTDNADNLYIGPGETYTLGGVHTYKVGVEVAASGILYVTAYNGAANTGWLELHAPTITIAGTVNGDGRGYRGATVPSSGGEGPGGGSDDGAGAGYGGVGGKSGWGNPGGPAYGTADGSDIQMGSGGARPGGGTAGNGGGMVSIIGNAVSVSGTITVFGIAGGDHNMWDGGGGGSGGGIFLKGNGVSVSGSLVAYGGNGGNDPTRKGGGGGAGGRIKVFYGCGGFVMTGTYTLTGGVGGTGGTGSGTAGGTGTYYSYHFVEPVISSIADVGYDQGRFVRLTWGRACLDDPLEAEPVTHYVVWRRIDALPSAPMAGTLQLQSYPAGTWDFIADVPARGEAEYSLVVPTLADSNIVNGMYWSTFFVSGVTDNPFVYYDSAPDSGYSVDNLSPEEPSALAGAYGGGATTLTWDPNEESDFSTYRLYRGTSAEFVPGPGNLIATQHTEGYVDNGPAGQFYKLSAVDFNGNVSSYALLTPQQTTGVGEITPGRLMALAPLANPMHGALSLAFSLAEDMPARIIVYDLGGRRVAEKHVSGPGTQTIGFGDLPSGIYWARLSQGAAQVTAKVVIIQ